MESVIGDIINEIEEIEEIENENEEEETNISGHGTFTTIICC